MGVTSAQRKAARQFLEIAKHNAGTTTGELNRQLGIYDKAEQQALSSAGVQFTDNSKTTSADRFAQLKNLQNSTKNILGGAGNALQGSQLGSLDGMLAERNDMDTSESLNTLRSNQQGVQNSLTTTQGELANSRRDAINTAAATLRDQESAVSTQLATLNSSLYKAPGHGSANLGASTMAGRVARIPTVKAKGSGYFLPDAKPKTAPAPTATPQGTSYFDKLMNLYNKRSA